MVTELRVGIWRDGKPDTFQTGWTLGMGVPDKQIVRGVAVIVRDLLLFERARPNE